MGMVRAVLFDLDDTLFDHQHCAREALLGVRELHPCFERFEASELEASHARILEALHLEVMSGRRDLDDARVERFRRLYAWAGIECDQGLATRTALAYRERYLGARTEVRGAAALLAAVRPHAQVVVVSNNLLDEQRDKLRHCGLDRHVDVLVVSEEAGVSKPDPHIFRLALQRAGATASEAVMVGDSWANDVEGARAAGIRAVWFSRDGTPARASDVQTIFSLEPAQDVLRLILGEPVTEVTREPASALRR
jgi:HAD superfamily hydrolase (TIGR01549 family)